jgi:hypothetical protein
MHDETWSRTVHWPMVVRTGPRRSNRPTRCVRLSNSGSVTRFPVKVPRIHARGSFLARILLAARLARCVSFSREANLRTAVGRVQPDSGARLACPPLLRSEAAAPSLVASCSSLGSIHALGRASSPLASMPAWLREFLRVISRGTKCRVAVVGGLLRLPAALGFRGPRNRLGWASPIWGPRPGGRATAPPPLDPPIRPLFAVTTSRNPSSGMTPMRSPPDGGTVGALCRALFDSPTCQ